MFSREPSRESEDSSNSLEPNRLLADFVGGLGPGQVAGRQALGAGSLGELQISIQVTLTSKFHQCNLYIYKGTPKNTDCYRPTSKITQSTTKHKESSLAVSHTL